MKSIRAKITLCLILTVLTALAVVGSFSIIANYNGTLTTVNHMMSETAVLAAERVEQELTAYKNVVMDTGCISQLFDPSVPLDEKRTIIDERAAMHNFQRGNVIGVDGISIFDGNDYSDREYVRQAMQGNIYVSEPLISKITGELTIMVAAPLYADGIYDSSIAGVVYFVPNETFLNDIVSSIQIRDNSRAEEGAAASEQLNTPTVLLTPSIKSIYTNHSIQAACLGFPIPSTVKNFVGLSSADLQRYSIFSFLWELRISSSNSFFAAQLP